MMMPEYTGSRVCGKLGRNFGDLLLFSFYHTLRSDERNPQKV